MQQNFIFIQSANLNELSLDSMLRSSLLSPQVVKQAETFSLNKQKQFIACRYLLAELLNEHFSITALPNIKTIENGRPQFEKSNLPDFNISHSGDFVAVAITTIGKIGLDIEFDRPRKNIAAIAKQFFSEQENNWLSQQKDTLAAFWKLWTLRESALKLYGKGVWQMREMAIMMPEQQVNAKFATGFYLHHQKVEQIYLSICCDLPIYSILVN
ncbi:4'-phosphopantetheinyl transferase superfamily protein [Orbus sturtevantii]|uniref:4'-phosphopantetheinyl transferase family protein n=1 Tax=Orbus sturtevantii TaxID=3074109 RepID=UPI00370D6835